MTESLTARRLDRDGLARGNNWLNYSPRRRVSFFALMQNFLANGNRNNKMHDILFFFDNLRTNLLQAVPLLIGRSVYSKFYY